MSTASYSSMSDEYFMREALDEAKIALSKEEVPIGAVLVLDNEVISRGHNMVASEHDPTAHAELITVKKASKRIGNERLIGSTLYVTVEPCSMCAGALVLARVKRIVFAASDPKAGAMGSVFKIGITKSLNHKFSITRGVLKEESVKLLQNFFKTRRL